MKIKKVAIITGSRSDYGILKPLIKSIEKDKDLEAQLVVTGTHFVKSLGETVNEIIKDGFLINEKAIPTDIRYMPSQAEYVSDLILKLEKSFKKLEPDIVLLLGDRLEVLATTIVASTLNIPIGHIHAGDKTDSGHIDEQIRFAVSQFSHLMFTPTKLCKERLIRRGEQEFRVHNVGTLGVESLLDTEKYSVEKTSKEIGLDLTKDTAIVLFHPVIHEKESMGKQMEELLEGVRLSGIQAVIIYPNGDEGSNQIINSIIDYSKVKRFVTFKSLNHKLFVNLMRHAKLMIGNSSSGIIEAPALNLRVINVGSRNVGREHSKSLVFVEPEHKLVRDTINYVMNLIGIYESPWGGTKVSERIIRILKDTELEDRFLRKVITI
ncbi:MAG: UDP-N-acetylglucosamine 2-epimerase [Cellulophaga sp.]